MQRRTLFSLMAAAFLISCIGSASASDIKSLMDQVPPGANVVMVIDVKRTAATPMALKNGWQDRLNSKTADRPMYIPPEADKAVIAVQADLVRGFERKWEVAYLSMSEQIPMRLIARAEGGYVDQINGKEAAWVPSDAYIVQVTPEILGVLAPADRQAISRWAEKSPAATRGGVSDFLKHAAEAVTNGPQIVLAVDAEGATQVHRIREMLKTSEVITKHKLDVTATTGLLTGLRGATLEITIGEDAKGVARIEFTDQVTLNDAAAKDLILAAVDSMQMSVPGLETWKCTVSGRTITLDGNMTMDGLRRALSIAELPSSKFSSLKDENTETSSADDIAKASLTYYKTIESLLKDLKGQSKSSSTDAFWIDRYATKIDKLPILHVDDELLEYGQKLTETLRVMSGSRKQTNLEGGQAARAAKANGGIYYGDTGYGYGYYNYSNRSREADAANARSYAAAEGTSVKTQGWNLIDNATTEIRQQMTKRYNIEF
ncbi:MAG: hypothetical protein JNL58_24225 [Planctomyces sp.]|nr:hypothetical protein [Planctomyces sp.]